MEVERRGALLVAEARDQLDALTEVVVDAREHLEEARVDRLLGAGALAAPEVVELVERVGVVAAVLVVEVDRERLTEVDRVELDLARRLVERLVAQLVGGSEAAGEGGLAAALLRLLALDGGRCRRRLGRRPARRAEAVPSIAVPAKRDAANQIDFRNGLCLPDIATLLSLMPPVGSARIVWAREPPITYIPSGPRGLRLDHRRTFSTVASPRSKVRQENFTSLIRKLALGGSSAVSKGRW